MPGAGDKPTQRTTFRPPWVRDGPDPLPMPAAPWTLNSRRDSKTNTDEAPAFTKVTLKSVPKPVDHGGATDKPAESILSDVKLRKTSKITVVPSQPSVDKNAGQFPTTTLSKAQENGRSEPSSRPQLERQVRLDKSRSRFNEPNPPSTAETTTGAPTIARSSSRANIPPPPPPRPPPPPPSRAIVQELKDLPPLSKKQQNTLDMLKSRPRKRPDWAHMMKEIETGRKLNHVVCNDRSAPLIERVKQVTAEKSGSTVFVFDSEKSNVHNKLLQQIQDGVKLKKVQTNDRSKPVLDGLRKFRRQMTIEEQIQKAQNPEVEEEIIDEMDDIDAVRDDLQSTKQMLALELRNKEASERENKRLQARILNLEVELEREKAKKNIQEYKQQDQALIDSLRKETNQARKDVEKLESDYMHVTEERDKTKFELEEMKKMYSNLEKRMKAVLNQDICYGKDLRGRYINGSDGEFDIRSESKSGSSESDSQFDDKPLKLYFTQCDKPIVELADDSSDEGWWDVSGMALTGCPTAKEVAKIAMQKSIEAPPAESESSEESEETSEEESDEDEDPKKAEDKRLQREIKLMDTKINNLKHKTDNAMKERHTLKDQIKQQQNLIKEEKKKFKRLKKEVDKMAKLMADTDDDDEEEEEEEEEDEETEEKEEEETESEEESESEESEEEESDVDNENDPLPKRKNKLQDRVKRHEGRLSSLKKGNYLLKAQVDRLKDDLVKQREESVSLQEDLDSVLAELG